MINVTCDCQTVISAGEDAVNQDHPCPTCGKVIRIVSGEAVPAGAGAGDFDV
jgi:hypothetical protein